MGETGSEDPRTLQRLLDVGRSLVAEHDLEAILRRVLEVGRELTGARYAALGILDEERTGLERFITLGIDDQTRATIGDLPRGRGVLGLLIQRPYPLRLDDVGTHPRSYGFPPGHPPMRTFLGVPILIRGAAWGNLYLTEKEGGRFDDADEHAAIVLGEWAAVAIENARLYNRTEQRRSELERAVRQLEATAEIARAIGGETDLDRILETIVKRGRALVEARSMLVLLRQGDELVVAAAAGEVDPDSRGKALPVEGSTAGLVLKRLRPERVSDIAARLRISPQGLGVEATTALLVPLSFRGEQLGVIVAFDRIGDAPEFGEEDERLLISFAVSAATAVATAKSVAEDLLRQSIAAAESERARWARELHDETLQGLGALRVLLASALRRGTTGALSGAVEQAVEQINSEITGLRALISELRSAALDQLGLAAALEGLAQRTNEEVGVNVDAEISLAHARGEIESRLHPEVENAVYRTVQEALTNVIKHSDADLVRLRVTEARDVIEVFVRDDGAGFDPEAIGTGQGFGLVGMRERVTMVGGRLDLTSSPGEGTTVWAVVPASHLDLGGQFSAAS